jgi:hypothetical protein
MYPQALTGITINEIYVHEPGSVISNIVLTLFCLFILVKIGRSENDFQHNWKMFLVFLGLGAFGGIFSHGFPTYFGETGFFWLWAVKGAFIPVANRYAILGVKRTQNISKIVKRVLAIKAILAIALSVYFYNFLPIAIDLMVTYIIVLVYSFKQKNENGAYRLIFASFVFALVTGLIYPFKLDIDPIWFTHKDLAHYFALVSLWFIYLAIRYNKKHH